MEELGKTLHAVEEKEPACDQLWESFRLGSKDAFEDIFRAYYAVLFSYGMRLSGSEAEVKDAIQSLFLHLWERRQFLGPTTSIKNYLLASLRRLLHKRIESTLYFDEWDEDRFDFQVELSIESELIRGQTQAENARRLKAVFDKLPVRQKEAVYLRFYEEQDFHEIAHIMNISTRAVYKLIYKGLENLQNQLEGGYIDLTLLLVLLSLGMI